MGKSAQAILSCSLRAAPGQRRALRDLARQQCLYSEGRINHQHRNVGIPVTRASEKNEGNEDGCRNDPMDENPFLCPVTPLAQASK